MYKNSAELPCKDKKIILRNPRNYKLDVDPQSYDDASPMSTYR